jgi:ABC-type transport system involved in multi-copper enzyme maturation permease subunit
MTLDKAALKLKVETISRSPSIEVFRKALIYDLFSPIKFTFSVLLIALFPILFFFITGYSGPAPTASSISRMPTWALFFLTYDLMFPIILLISTAAIISKEFSDGTILVLDSFSLSRLEIMLYKSFAVLVYSLLLTIVSVFAMITPVFFIFGFYDVFDFLIINLLYSLSIIPFWLLTFLGLSALFTNPRYVLIGGMGFLMYFLLLGFLTLNPTSYGGQNSYSEYYLYLFDLNYHAGNVFNWIYEMFGQFTLFGNFTMLFNMLAFPHLFTHDYMSVELVATNYLPPAASLAILTCIGLAIFLLGYLRFRYRELL